MNAHNSLHAGNDNPAETQRERERMVRYQIESRGVTDPRVLAAMLKVPRHRFVDAGQRARAYDDGPLPIGYGQTISQPYIVALMTELARPEPGSRALEIGTGCGYQAAVLAELVDRVDSVEIVPQLAESAAVRLSELGYRNVVVHQTDGTFGWAEHAPYDLILAAAAPREIPTALIDQLAPGGRLVLPIGVGRGGQTLLCVEKRGDGSVHEREVIPVAFVPMTGAAADA